MALSRISIYKCGKKKSQKNFGDVIVALGLILVKMYTQKTFVSEKKCRHMLSRTPRREVEELMCQWLETNFYGVFHCLGGLLRLVIVFYQSKNKRFVPCTCDLKHDF